MKAAWSRVLRRRWRAALAWCAAAGAALAVLARVAAPPALASVAEFPRTRPADLAHLLADVSAHTVPRGQPWSLDEEAGNYTTWRYAVSWRCGARCAGRVSVRAHADYASTPQHAAATRHRVSVRRQHCHTLPLLPWPTLCEEVETESVVSAAGERGARLTERARAPCGWAAALAARCVSGAALAADRAAHLAQLRALLPA